jgi:hypothetical protein
MVTPIAFACEAGRLATFTGSATFEDKTEDSSRSQKRPDLHDLLVEECGFAECGRRLMGRAGFEPATLGLKVRPERPKRAVGNGNWLQRAKTTAARS